MATVRIAARALRDLINFLLFAGFFVVDQSGQRGVHVWVILDALGAGARGGAAMKWRTHCPGVNKQIRTHETPVARGVGRGA